MLREQACRRTNRIVDAVTADRSQLGRANSVFVTRSDGTNPVEVKHALLVYIEPTPYVLGLIREIAKHERVQVEALFLDANVSQAWNLTLQDDSASYLPVGHLAAALEIRRKLATGRYDLLHLAGWGHPVLLFASILGWWLRIPVFMESDTPLPIGLPLWKRAIKRSLYPVLFKIPAMVLPGGSRQAEYFRNYGVGAGRIVNAQMTVDVVEMSKHSAVIRAHGQRSDLRRKFGLDEDQTVFIYVGRLEPHKGIRLLLEAFGDLAKDYPKAALLFAGDGSQRAIVISASVSNHAIKYAGRLSSEEVLSAYNSADIAVLPSDFEPWGLVVNEAMAVGLPVVVSDRVGCVDDLVKDGQTGLIFPAGDKRRLELAMRHMIEHAEERRKMSDRAAALISQWTLENWANNIVESWSRARVGV